MTEREKIEATVELFYRQAKDDAAHHDWFMARLAEVARQAQTGRRRRKGARKK